MMSILPYVPLMMVFLLVYMMYREFTKGDF